MDLREHVRHAIESVWEHRGRTIASSAGVLWGTTAIVLLLASASGFRDFMKQELSRYGDGCVFLYPAVTSSGFRGYRRGVKVRLSREDAAAAARARPDQIEALIPEHQSERRALVEGAGGRLRRMDLSASDERYARYRAFHLAEGQFFDARDVDRSAAVAVLGARAAEELFGTTVGVVGRTIRIRDRPFTVLGVTEPKGRQYHETSRPDDRLVMVPLTSAESRLGYPQDSVSRLLLFPRPGVVGESAVRAAFDVLGPRAHFHPDDHDAVKWYDTTVLLEMVDHFYAGFTAFVAVAGLMTLLVGAVGIANYQLAILAERSVEIAVAKAIGARNRILVFETVVSAVLVAGSAASLGALLGLAACAAIAFGIPAGLFPFPIVSVFAVSVTAGAMVGAAITASLIPALRVRRIEVSRALRAQ